MKIKSKEIFGSALIAMLWPFGALLFSLRNVRSEQSKIILFVFCLWIGAIYIFNDSYGSMETATVTSNDGYKIALQFHYAHAQDVDFVTFFKNRSMHDSMDFFQITSIYFLSRLTDNPRLWFLYIAFIYAFFYVNNIWYVLSRCKNPVKWYCGLFIALLFFCIPITEGLNASRMNLAIQIYLYGLLPYLLDDDKKKLWISCLCLLVHFSMILPVALLLLFFFLPKKNLTPYIVLFFISFFIQQLDIGFIKGALTYLPLGYEDRAGLYLDDLTVEAEEVWKQQSSFIYTLSRNSKQYICFIVMAFMFFFNRKALESTRWKKLLVFSLLIYSIANILALLPSGYRFLRISNSLLISWIVLSMNEEISYGLKNLIGFVSPLIAFSIVFMIRTMFDYVGFEVFWGNFITTIFVNDNVRISRILGLSI